MNKAIGISMFVAALSISGALYADDQVDCSNIPAKDADKHYKSGDVVTDANGSGKFAFRCTSGDCFRTPTSSNGNAFWALVGKCKPGT
jgi:hypothetical protein